jgi:hypothetical protein
MIKIVGLLNDVGDFLLILASCLTFLTFGRLRCDSLDQRSQECSRPGGRTTSLILATFSLFGQIMKLRGSKSSSGPNARTLVYGLLSLFNIVFVEPFALFLPIIGVFLGRGLVLLGLKLSGGYCRLNDRG